MSIFGVLSDGKASSDIDSLDLKQTLESPGLKWFDPSHYYLDLDAVGQERYWIGRDSERRSVW